MVAEASDGPAICRVGSRTLHQYWHLLAPCFRSVLLAPNRRVGEAGAYWTWQEPAGRGPPGPVDLTRVRQRLGDAFSLFFDTLDHDTPLNEESSVPVELRLAIEDVVTALQACDDARLAAYVCRTEAGWFVHSWGVTPAAVPRVLDEQAGASSNSSDDAENDEDGRSHDTKTASRRRRRVLLLLGLLLLGSATSGGVWWSQRSSRSLKKQDAVNAPAATAPEFRARSTRVTGTPEPASPVGKVRESPVVSRASEARSNPEGPEPTSAGWPERAFSSQRPMAFPKPVSSRPNQPAESPGDVPAARWDAKHELGTQRLPASEWSTALPTEMVGAAPELPGGVPQVAVSGRPQGQPAPPQVTASDGGRMPAANLVEVERSTNGRIQTLVQRPTLPRPLEATGGGAGRLMEGEPAGAEASTAWPRAGLTLSSPSGQVRMTGAAGQTGVPVSAPAPAPDSQRDKASEKAGGAPGGTVAAGSALALGGGSGNGAGRGLSAAGARGSGGLPSTAESTNSEAAVEPGSMDAEGRQSMSGESLSAQGLPTARARSMSLPGTDVAQPGGYAGLDEFSSPAGWLREITVTASQLQLLRDTIVPTGIEAADESSGESLEGLRERFLQQREAEMPATLRRPDVRWTCVIELPADATGATWSTSAESADAVTWTIGDARAELTWQSGTLARPLLLELATAGRGDEVIRLELHANGRLRLQAGEPHRVWIAATVVEDHADSVTETDRFRWREGTEPGGWLPATRSPDGWHRLDLISVENAAFEDRVTGWALLVKVKQVVLDRQ